MVNLGQVTVEDGWEFLRFSMENCLQKLDDNLLSIFAKKIISAY